MYEPPQKQHPQQPSDGGTYDSSALTEAARVAVAAAAARDGNEGGGSEACDTAGAAAAEVARAVRVAELLGLRLVGWCLSHDKVRQGQGMEGDSGGETGGKEEGGGRGVSEREGGGLGILCQGYMGSGILVFGFWHVPRAWRPFLGFGEIFVFCYSCSGEASGANDRPIQRGVFDWDRARGPQVFPPPAV